MNDAERDHADWLASFSNPITLKDCLKEAISKYYEYLALNPTSSYYQDRLNSCIRQLIELEKEV